MYVASTLSHDFPLTFCRNGITFSSYTNSQFLLKSIHLLACPVHVKPDTLLLPVDGHLPFSDLELWWPLLPHHPGHVDVPVSDLGPQDHCYHILQAISMFLFKIWDLNGHCYHIFQVMLMFLFQIWDLTGQCYHVLQVTLMFLFQIWDLNGHGFHIFEVMLMFLSQVWDLNGHCYHIVRVIESSRSAHIGSILVFKRRELAVRWAE